MKENSIGDRIEEKYTRYINCETDILELTIEEAIFILEKNASVHYVEDLLQEAYKVILLDYKRVLKENEDLKNDLYQDGLSHKYLTLKATSIPTSVIQNKLSEIDEKIKNYKSLQELNELQAQKFILELILEKGNK